MQHSFHCHLRKSFSWYHHWHNHPHHHHAHWLLFIVITILTSSFISRQIGEFYYENNQYQARAQTGLTIGLNGENFTINGVNKFTLVMSYFSGMMASPTILSSDFAAIKSLGFDGIRILPNWPCNSCTQNPNFKLFDSSSNYRPGMLTQLQTILQTAENNGLFVDLTFTGADTISGITFDAYKIGIENTTRDIIGFRNVIFDLQNERDVNVGDGRFLTTDQIKQLKDAVKVIDSARLVTASLTESTGTGGVSAYVNATGVDFVAYHDSRSGDWPDNTDDVINNIRGNLGSALKPIYLQEPERYRGTAPYADSDDDWFTAASNAKCAGAAGWTFHNSAAYDLSNGSSIFNNFGSIENSIVNGINSQLSGVVWGSCAGSGGGGGGGATGSQGICPDGYIELAGANASNTDPTATAGYFCDNDPVEATGVTYPVSGFLYCSASSGTAFYAPDSSGSCNFREGIRPGWSFDSSGQPIGVTIYGQVNCPGQLNVTVNNSSITAGAWTQTPSTEGVVCIPGTAITPTPTPSETSSPPPLTTPIPRYIYYIYPDFSPVETPVIIYGDNLSNTVQFYDASGSRFTYTGTINSDHTEVYINIPSELVPGEYIVKVGPDLADISNGLTFNIVIGTYVSGPTTTDPPIIISFTPTTVTRGDIVEISGDNLPPVVKLTSAASGQITIVIGIVNDGKDIVTITIPNSLALGLYTVEIASINGSAVAPGVLEVIGEAPGGLSAASAITPPGSTVKFQDLIGGAYNYALYIVGIAVFLVILYAGFLWMTSAANPGNISQAKQYIKNAILGAVLLISSYIILYTINPDLIGGTVNLPGIKPLPKEVIAPPGGANCNDPQALAQQYDNAYYPQPRTDTAYGGAPELDDLIRCVINNPSVNPIVDRSQIFTYEITNKLCNYTRGNPVCGACVHEIESCHYGGKRGTQGSLGVDFSALNSSESGETFLWDAIKTLATVCGFDPAKGGYVKLEQTSSKDWHTHVSTESCDSN